jgi:hypothetical protein
MTKERAMEILDPNHREKFESLDEVNEACEMGRRALKRLGELEEDEKQGKLVRLPCRIGDPIWWIAPENEEGIPELTVELMKTLVGAIVITENGIRVATDDADIVVECSDEIGSRFAYLSREDALSALKEMKK